MSDKLHNGKGFLKEKLSGYQVDPPDAVWNSISGRLGGRSKRRMIVLTLAAAASVALAVTLGITFFGPDIPSEEEMARTEQEQTTQPLVEEGAGQTEVTSTGEGKPETETGDVRETLEEQVVRTMQELNNEATIEQLTEINIAQQTETTDMQASEGKDKEPVSITQPPDDLARNQIEREAPDERSEPTEYAEPSLSDREPTDQDTKPEAENQEPDQIIDLSEELEEVGELDPLLDFEEQEKRVPRWNIGAAVSPQYSFRDAEAGALAANAIHESGMVSYAGGIHISYKTASRFAFESGIFFNKMGIAIGAPGIQQFNQSLDFAAMGQEAYRADVKAVTNSVGNIVAASGEVFVNNYKLNAANELNTFADANSSMLTSTNLAMHQHLDYLELPFNLRYTVLDRAFELQLIAGMSTNILVNNYVTIDSPEGPTDIGYLTNIRSINYSGNAGVGMIYHIRSQFSLRLEPRFRYFLNSINDATLPSTRPYAMGLYTGLSYTF